MVHLCPLVNLHKTLAVCLPNSSCCQATTSFGQKQVVHVLLTLGTSRLLLYARLCFAAQCFLYRTWETKRSSSKFMPEKSCKFVYTWQKYVGKGKEEYDLPIRFLCITAIIPRKVEKPKSQTIPITIAYC